MINDVFQHRNDGRSGKKHDRGTLERPTVIFIARYFIVSVWSRSLKTDRASFGEHFNSQATVEMPSPALGWQL